MNKDILEEQEFYDLMQNYRHAPFVRQLYVSECFENVKDFIREHFYNKNVGRVKKRKEKK